MYCPKCGAVIVPGVAFCGTCGANLPVPAAPPQPLQPEPSGQPAQAYQTPPYQAPTYQAAGAAAPYFPGWDYATWPTRAIGFIVDGLIIAVGMGLLWLVVGAMLGALVHGLCCMMILIFPLATFAVGLFNSVYLVSQRGFSIGQGLVKIKVVDQNGNLLTQGTALMRLLVRVAISFVPVLPLLDMLWPLWDVRRQTLHDKAVNCFVINNPSGV
jgi:uncharacterized RDD family membrane protein YckC